MKLVYIAGPYRSATPWGVLQNINAAAEVAARVHRAGMFAVCPHLNSAHMEGVADDAHFLAGTLEMMRRCDAVILVPGWERSAGSRAEVNEAINLGLPVLYAWGDESYCHGILCDLKSKPDGIRARQGEDTSVCPFIGGFWGAPIQRI
jgi:hypothetical protein